MNAARPLPEDWALPAVSPWNRQFFTTGKLMLQECSACGQVQHPPEEVCHHCLGMEFAAREMAGTGTIHSFIVVHHAVAPVLAPAVPYAVALVSLDDLPEVRVLGNVLNRAPQDLAIGQRVRAVFRELPAAEGEETILLPQWEVQ